MDTPEIIARMENAVRQFFQANLDNLTRNTSEENLYRHLTRYLEDAFDEYDVENDFNRDVDKENDKKALEIAREELIAAGLEKRLNNTGVYRIKPDIIIHHRGTNEDNLVVIEVKKDVSDKREKRYDLIKLRHLTTDYLGNHYNYQLGVALELGTGNTAGHVTYTYFQEGHQRRLEELQ